MSSQEIDDRRQRAAECVQDAFAPNIDLGTAQTAINAAHLGIEVATQVKITAEMIQSVAVAGQIPYLYQAEKIIKAFCAAAGFEVVE